MRIFEGWRKIKKVLILSLSFCIFSSVFSSSIVLAKTNYIYTQADCKAMGTVWKEGWVEWGCEVWVEDVFGGLTKKYKGDTNDLSNVNFYNVTGGDDKNIRCISGFKIGKNKEGFTGCVKNSSSASGLPPGRQESDIITKKECESRGGTWYNGLCGYRTDPKETINPQGRSISPKDIMRQEGYLITSNKSELPNEIYPPNGKCPSGYHKEELKSQGKTIIHCTKKADPNSDDDGDGKNNRVDDDDNDGVPNSDDPDYISPVEGTDNSSETSCAIDNVGWVICPASNFLAESVAGMYTFIADNFLTIKSGELFGIDKSTFASWGVFRDMANVILVIFFAIVIISQITNVGISNYGIKKMLPRLFIFAILINVSYFVSVIFVDISNILGRSVFNTLSSSGYHQVEKMPSDVRGMLALPAAGGVTVAVAAGGIIISLTAAILAVVLMFAIMIIRQAVVIMLVVVSPIAFASAILPNTESFFNKWKSTLKSMLIIFPTASLVMGGMLMASNILVASTDNILYQFLYTALPIAGLFSVYFVIKGALAIIDKITGGSVSGKIGGMLNGIQNRANNSRLAQRERNMRGWAGRSMANTKFGKFMRKGRLKALADQKALEGAKATDQRNELIGVYEEQERAGTLSRDGRNELNRLRAQKIKEQADLIKGGAIDVSSKFGYNDKGEYTGEYYSDAEKYIKNSIKPDGDGKVNVDRIDQAFKAIDASKHLSDSQKAKLYRSALTDMGPVNQGSAQAEAINRNADILGKFKDSDYALSKVVSNLSSGQVDFAAMKENPNTYVGMTSEQFAKQSEDSIENIENLRKQNAQLNAQVIQHAKMVQADVKLMNNIKDHNVEYINKLAGPRISASKFKLRRP